MMTTDLNMTSTGKGHEYKAPLVFPPLNFERSVIKPLPPPLQNKKKTYNIYLTTTGNAHDYKPHDEVLNNDVHKRAPGHWKVNYTANTISKLQERPQREELTMGNQQSEMKSEYKGKPVMSLETSFSKDNQPPVYKHHFNNGPLKTIQPSTDSFLLVKGKRYPVQDKGVFDYHGEMYQTTTQKDHRLFSKEELNDYPKKKYATFWECENYPKSWGHGSKENPLPTDSVARPTLEPMRDTLVFKTATVIPRIPTRLEPVPNTGMCSEVMANYKDIPSNDRDKLFECPVPKPLTYDQQLTGDKQLDLYAIPKMYYTEYETIGSGKLVTV